MEQIYRIGIDHGYGNIKTAHHIFQSGVVQKGSITELSGMTVEYEGKFYEIGSTHKEYQMDKVWDEDYYVLTLTGLEREVCSAYSGRRMTPAVLRSIGKDNGEDGESGTGRTDSAAGNMV